MSAPPPGSEPRLVRFGVFELDTRTRELRKRGTKLKLPEQSIQILATLLERGGELVTRDELQKKLWPNDTIVEFDHSINAAIKRLRQALGDTAETPRFIETLPRRGYRFIYPVPSETGQPNESPKDNPPPRRRWLSSAAAAGLAILAVSGAVWVGKRTNAGSRTPQPSRENPLISLPGAVSSPSFSPDGKQVAYSWRDAEGAGGAGMYVKLVEAGTALRLTNPPQDDHTPKWSPDGQWVAFWRHLPPNSGVHVVSALGGSARRITGLESCGGLDWLPDGQHLLVSQSRVVPEEPGNGSTTATAPSRLWLVAVETGQRQPLTSPPAGTLRFRSCSFARWRDGSDCSVERSRRL